MLAPPQGLVANSLSPAVAAAITAEIQAAVVGLFDFKGSTDASTNPNYPAALKGDAYVVSVAGKIGGASGLTVEVGDLYFALSDNAGGTQAAVGSSWDVLQYNITGITAAGLAMIQAANAAAQLALLAPIPLTSLASQADQTIVGNVSGGAASPIALTATQVETMLQGTARTQQDFASAVGGTATARLGWLAAGVLAMALTASDTPSGRTLEIGDRSLIGSGSNNIGGGDATLRSGLGKGTGTASSIIFQTPTLAASGTGTQAFATRLTIATAAITATVPIIAPSGVVGTPTVAFTGDTGAGLWWGGSAGTGVVINGTGGQGNLFVRYNEVRVAAGLPFGFSSSAQPQSGALDAMWIRIGAANIRQGNASSASPVAQIFTLGEASRPGTDSNTSGASGTFQTGLGTGNVNSAVLAFQTPTVAASGNGVQAYATRLTIATTSITATVQVFSSITYAASTPMFAAAGATGSGCGFTSSGTFFSVAGASVGAVQGIGLVATNNKGIGWTAGAADGTTSFDTAFTRIAAASIQANDGTPGNFAFLQGKLKTDNAYVAGVTVPTGSVVIYDSTGTAYRVSVVI